MPTVEDYFDDDTDLPLPSSSKPRHLADTGLKGALVEEITSDDDQDGMDFGRLAEQSRGVFGENATAPPPSSAPGKGKMVVRSGDDELRPAAPGGQPNINPNSPMGGFMGDMMKLQQAEDERLAKLKAQFGNASVAMDPSTYKGWNTVYPLYFDAKVSIADGRRVPRKSAIWWPQATLIAQACRALGLSSVLEPDRCHPADWENPGRVKVQFEKDGRFLNPIIKNRTQLYKHLADQLIQRNPKLAFTANRTSSKRSSKPTTAPSSSKVKGKVQATAKSSAKGGKGKSKASGSNSKKETANPVVPIKLPTRPPLAPQPLPTLDDRLPLHSPVVPAGVAVAAIKRDIDSEKEAKKKGLPAVGGAEGEGGKDKMPKMKRVMVRGKR
ncbi:hypothetical protein IAU60_001765 [Kwoniella sp. DSM 27419]